MSDISKDEQLLLDAQAKGGLSILKSYVKLSGPGWLQSAITLGGGSLAGALFLGVIGGYSMLWVQVLAMILGVIMLSAIGYVTLSTGRSPYRGIYEEINPILAVLWLVASLIANMVWVLPQYSLAYGAVTDNLMPGSFQGTSGKYTVSGILFVIVTLITFSYGTKGVGIKIYERILKLMVAFIVLSFFGVVVKLAGELPWGEILSGFIPNFGLWNSPVEGYRNLIAQLPSEEAQAYWESIVVSSQRDRMIAAAAAAVGINMTFLLPYSMLSKKWNKNFRGLAIFDLSTGMVIPFVLATGCVVIAAAYSFHNKPFNGVLVEQNGAMVLNVDSPKAGEVNKILAGRSAALEAVAVDPLEVQVAARLIKRDVKQFASALAELTKSETIANKVFGLGVLAMAMSTISLLMLISGFCLCELFGWKHEGWRFRLCCLAATTGLLWPILWTGGSKAYLAVVVGVFGYMLLPIAFITFFVMMNSKRLLGDEKPKGGKLLLWNALMLVSLVITGVASIHTAYGKKVAVGEKMIPLGFYMMIAIFVLIIIGFFLPKKGRSSTQA